MSDPNESPGDAPAPAPAAAPDVSRQIAELTDAVNQLLAAQRQQQQQPHAPADSDATGTSCESGGNVNSPSIMRSRPIGTKIQRRASTCPGSRRRGEAVRERTATAWSPR